MTEGFIEAVREFPCLWNVSSKSFKDVHAKENAWKAIAEKLKASAPAKGKKRPREVLQDDENSHLPVDSEDESEELSTDEEVDNSGEPHRNDVPAGPAAEIDHSTSHSSLYYLMGDPWISIRQLITDFNITREQFVVPGQHVVVDECMSSWTGSEAEYVAEGMPHKTKIVRKPEGVGAELKAMACGSTGILLKLDIMEGKEANHLKPFSAVWRKIVHADSAFLSVKTLLALKERGLFKTSQLMKHKKYKSKHQVYPIIHLRNHLTHNLRYRKIVMQKVTKVNSECATPQSQKGIRVDIECATPQSKKTCRRMDECDKLLVQSLKDIQERSHQRQAQREDTDTNFCLSRGGRAIKEASPKGKCIC
ncbi:hypothetical protein EMCRGX_G029695 [Ephydatia muelleri]